MTATDSLSETPADMDYARLRRDMLRFAVLQLRDQAAAEDAVQEALAGALAKGATFGGRSRYKTWVFSILRHKIADTLRERARHPTQQLTPDERDDHPLEYALESQFTERGHWRREARPRDWGDPEEVLASEQFWQLFEACLDHLPEQTARVFMMREFVGLETAEICRELELKRNNCWVILHRARGRLRLCLEENWLRDGEASAC